MKITITNIINNNNQDSNNIGQGFMFISIN